MRHQVSSLSACLLLAASSVNAQADKSVHESAATDASMVDPVVVTGKPVQYRDGIQPQLTPGAVTIIDAEELNQRSVNNMADALRYVPGIWAVSGSGSDEVRLYSRGSNLDAIGYDMNGILLLRNGLPITLADGSNHNRFGDPAGAARIVVARGANALIYGAATLGGAINIITPTARMVSPLTLAVSGGSYGSLDARIRAGGVWGNFDALATLVKETWEGFRDHSSQQSLSLYTNAGWQLSEQMTTRLFVSYMNSKMELPGALTRAEVEADPSQASPFAVRGDYRKNVETWRVATKTTYITDDGSKVEFGLSFEEQSLYHPIVVPPIPAVGKPYAYSLLVDTNSHNIGTMLRFNTLVGNHDLVAGFRLSHLWQTGGNYENRRGHHSGLMNRVHDRATTLVGYIVDRWHLSPSWTLVYGTQAIYAKRVKFTVPPRPTRPGNTVTFRSQSYTALNPRVGVIYQFGEHREAFVSVSRLFEAPTTYKVHDDVHNAPLNAMRGTVAEIGTRGRVTLDTGNRLRWSLTAYYAKIEDEILSVDNPRPGFPRTLTTNVEQTIHGGVEAVFAGTINVGVGSIEPLISATWNSFHFGDNTAYAGNRMPVAPRYFVRAEILYRHPSGFYLGPTFDLVGDRFVDYVNSYEVEGYQLVGLRAGYSGEHWQVYADFHNLTDENYITRVSPLVNAKPGSRVLYPGMPLSINVGVRYEF